MIPRQLQNFFVNGPLHLVGSVANCASKRRALMTASTSAGNLTELLKWAKLGSELPFADHVDQFDAGDG